MNRVPPAHKQMQLEMDFDISVEYETGRVTLIDFDSDEPLACPVDKADGETCESCQ